MMNTTEVILLSHGSRREEANKDVLALARLMQEYREEQKVDVSAAFLQFAEPSLPEAIKKAVHVGKELILVAPLFLTSGVHITEDIPEAVEEAERLYPGVKIKQCSPLGCDRRLVPIIWDRVEGLI